MRTTVKELRKLIREETEYSEAIAQLFSENADFGSILNDVLQDLFNTNKKIEKAHELAPQGPAKAIIAGLHSDLFNQAAEFRKYIDQLKKLANQRAEGFHRKPKRRS